MKFNNRQLPRSEKDYVKGISSSIPYVVRNETGDWRQDLPTFKDQRADGFDTDDCWIFAGLKVIATQCNFLLRLGQFPEATIAWFTQNGYLDSSGKFAFSERFIAALATYPDGSPVRDGGNDQIQLSKLVCQYGLLPRADFDADPSLNFVSQEAFNDYYYDSTKVTPAMRAKALQALTYVNIAYEWVGKEGSMPPLQDIRATTLQAPPQIGIPIPQDVSKWNSAFIQYDGTPTVSHSVALTYIPPSNEFDIDDQYQPEQKTLSADYLIPMVTLIYVTPIIAPPYTPPSTAVPLPDPQSLIVKIWTAIASYFASLFGS